MSYLPFSVAEIVPEWYDAEFWENCRRRRFAIQRCEECRHFQHPPLPVCSHCQSRALKYEDVVGTGTVFTYTIVHHAAHPALADVVPYNISLILLDGVEDVRFLSNVIDVEPDELSIGTRVSLVWDEGAEGMWLPRFRAHGPIEGGH